MPPRTLHELSVAIDDFHLSTPMATYQKLNNELKELLEHSSSVGEKSLLFNLLDTLEAKAEATEKNHSRVQNQAQHSHAKSVEFDANRYFEALETAAASPQKTKQAQITPQQANRNEAQSQNFKENLKQSKDHLPQQEKALAQEKQKRAEKKKDLGSKEEKKAHDNSKKLK